MRPWPISFRYYGPLPFSAINAPVERWKFDAFFEYGSRGGGGSTELYILISRMWALAAV